MKASVRPMNDAIASVKRIVSDPPRPSSRIAVSVVIGIVAGALIFQQYSTDTAFHTDFGMSWFGARSILRGIDPYPLVGRGLEFDYRWPLTYPAPSFIALLPLGFLSEKIAAVIFVALSSFLLAFGATKKGWQLLPLFCTEPFVNAARLGQWNILITAALFFPCLSAFAGVKPQAAAPILAASTSRTAWTWSLGGTIALMSLSLILLPGWIPEWIAAVNQMPDTSPPLTRFGGLFVLLVLFRWRRADSWLVLACAVVPQTPAFYSLLPLMTIPATFVQSVFLAATITVGGYAGASLVPEMHSIDQLHSYLGSMQIFIAFLPATILVLLRPNTDKPPYWIATLFKFTRRARNDAN